MPFRRPSPSSSGGDVAGGVAALKIRETSASLDNLPTELVVRVLDFVHVKFVYRIMRVNRKLQAVARDVISKRTGLAFHNQFYIPKQVSPLDRIEIGCVKDRNSMLNGLRQMKHLKVLIGGPAADNLIRFLAQQNSATLEILWLKELPLSPGTEFPKLQELRCRNLTADDVYACPELTSLIFSEQTDMHVLVLLKGDKITQFDATTGCDSESLVSLVQGLKRLTRLRKLHLQLRGMSDDQDDFQDEDAEGLDTAPLHSLFDTFTGLQDVMLWLSFDTDVNLDAAIATLVTRNPGLKRIFVEGPNLTDDTLTALARLRHLSSIDLNPAQHQFTADAIRSLLRGGSRRELRYFRLFTPAAMNLTEIRAEINLMIQESGLVDQSEANDGSWTGIEFDLRE